MYPERLGLPDGLAVNLPAMQETQVWSLGQEDPVEEGMATHTEEPGGLQSTGLHRVRQTEHASVYSERLL